MILLIHELGHFTLAKLNGIRVDEFSLGMGPTLFGKEFKGTKFSLKLLPLGGACMMGEDDADDTSEGSFNSKSVWARISVIAAGPLFNFILALLMSAILVGAAGYAVSATTEFSKKYFNKGLKEKVRLTIQGQVLDAAEEKCQETYLMMSYSDQNMGVVIVPDTISFPKASRHASYLLADYSPKYDTKEFRNYMDSDEFRYQKEFTEDELLSVSTQSEIYDESIGSSGVVIFVAIYLGLVFIISGAALLALKELSDAIDGREKYRILQQLGVSEKELGHTLFLQMAVFFAFPLLLAMIHSIFGIQVCIELLSIYDIKAIIPALLICAAMIVGIYGGYFLLSYRGCKRIIITKRIR